MGLFDKKYCGVCGEKIGLFGNRKLEDGNLCKDCAAKLSPLFSDRRNSTLNEIKEQLAYREQNQTEVARFNITRTLGNGTKLLLDDNAKKFMVTSARNIEEANPDVISFSQVTGCHVDVNEDKHELMREGKDGKEISYNPPRYTYEYNMYAVINVNAPYFDEIRIRLDRGGIESDVQIVGKSARSVTDKIPVEYEECEKMGDEIIAAFTASGEKATSNEEKPASQSAEVTCPWCGAKAAPDANGKCEYCGGTL